MARRFSEAASPPSRSSQDYNNTNNNNNNSNSADSTSLLHSAHPNVSSVSLASSFHSATTDTNWANRLDDFELKSPIGYGSSAVVYGAVYKPTKRKVALKMIDLDMFERNQIDELRRETALMALSKHPNVLRVYGSFVNGSKLYIVTPYLSAGGVTYVGSCLDIIKTGFQHGFEEVTIATILRQALEGLVYLHKNGHIHRDVKAGNLLMDDHGGVLLADFGVSSSLAENGDVRKTFVGTPCWMAPEVMEQAGYDYKADIWSFGITALELAKGHAPFAKFPPMKVLMLTLSNDPPTLDRESTVHKYSRAFKDMIDCCLQKDPQKRPTAEKLLHHTFFKQAKKKEYLVKSVLAHVPPLDQRPHKRVPQKAITFESTEQWDFDTPSTEEPPASVPPTAAANVAATHNTTTTTNNNNNNNGKKHISFGDVVIRDPPKPDHEQQQQQQQQPPQQPKKSRFSINPESTTNSTSSSSDIAPLPLSRLCSQDSVTGERKSRFEVQQQSQQQQQQQQQHPSSGSESALSRENSNSSGLSLPRNSSTSSTKSSRFSVEIENPAGREHHHHHQQQQQQQPSSNPPAASNEAAVAAATAAAIATGPGGPLPPECRKKGRFELIGDTTTTSSASGTTTSTTTSKPNNNNNTITTSTPSTHPHEHVESPISSLSGSPNTSPYTSLSRDHQSTANAARLLTSATTTCHDNSNTAGGVPAIVYTQLEALLKQTDTQRTLLNDMMMNVKKSPETTLTTHDTVEHLQQLLSASLRERDRLSRENDALKREVDRLRRHQ
ncbi:kinase-like domain-containing protein [Zychaea mexicana]|uniref:kinase-like domain-containing protein n=1 Tax=Zychaea mexicana TaxID=64656 RepID=UPI0022FEB0E7|nr:kinase-like domain-containing protein [Zychaea mexicana]KAI9497652.1 kinase-like domain-containing protein [Zychaea mexicana]